MRGAASGNQRFYADLEEERKGEVAPMSGAAAEAIAGRLADIQARAPLRHRPAAAPPAVGSGRRWSLPSGPNQAN